MDQQNNGKVTYGIFNEIMKKYPKLLEIVDVLNEGLTFNAQESDKSAFEQKLYQKHLEKTIEKIDNSIKELHIFQRSMGRMETQINVTECVKNEKNDNNNHKRGPEFGHYIKSVNFDKEEDKFGLEEKENQTSFPHINEETTKAILFNLTEKSSVVLNTNLIFEKEGDFFFFFFFFLFLSEVKNDFADVFERQINKTIQNFQEIKEDILNWKKSYKVSMNEEGKKDDEDLENLQLRIFHWVYLYNF